MGINILSNKEDDAAVFYHSSSEWAFGPVMPNLDSAEAFLKTFDRSTDIVLMGDAELEKLWNKFRNEVLTCPKCQDPEPDITNYATRTEFDCRKKQCRYRWDHNGVERVEEVEEEEDGIRTSLR